jgi:proline iminopeptidase
MQVPGHLMSLSGFAGTSRDTSWAYSHLAMTCGHTWKDISVTTLVIVGRYDWVCPPAGSRMLAAGLPTPSS